MVLEVYIKKTAGGFIPTGGDFDLVPMGKELKAHVFSPTRSTKQNRWFHKVLRELFGMQETWPTFTLFRNKIKEALGCGEFYEVHGKIYFDPASIAFHKMKQPDFNEFCNRFVKLVCKRILPHMSEKEVWEILKLLDADTGVLGHRQIDLTPPKERKTA